MGAKTKPTSKDKTDDEDEENDESPPKKAKTSKPKPAAAKSSKSDPSGSLSNKEMIMKALEGLDEKNGSSVVAIKNYIAENWPEKAESSQFSNSFKKALAALAEDSSIVRPKKQEGNPDGVTGSYKINKEKSKEKEKEAKEKEKAAKEKEKEKEKAAKEKEKEKEKAAKGKEKEKAAKEKEKDKAGKKASSSTKTESSGPPNNKEMIMKALEGLDEKNGSSVVAIKNYIAENWPE